MNNIVNISLQILPTSQTKHPYTIVDEAISIIKASGLKYVVCPFETVMEGNYDKIMDTVKKVLEATLENGATSIFSNVKIQIKKDEDVSINDKIGKYKKKGD